MNNHPLKSLPPYRSMLRHCLYHSIITTKITDVVIHILNLLRRRQGNVHDKIVQNMSVVKRHIESIYTDIHHTHFPTKKEKMNTILSKIIKI